MKLTVTQENLARALVAVGRVANGKTPLPILNNILLRTSNNRLLIAATNLEIAIVEHIGAKVVNDGAITIPARLVMDFVSNLPKGNINLEVKESHLYIESGSYKSVINGILADEFPELPTITEKEAITLDIEASVFKKAVSQTIITASSDTTRPVLTGVYTHTFNGSFFVAATDGYRLAERRLNGLKDTLSAIIPASTFQDVLRVTPDDCSKVNILFNDNQVRFRMDNIEVTSRLIDDTFPDYRKLIPQKSDIVIKIDKDEFLRITKIASLFARESAGSITIKTHAKKNTLSIHSIASQLGENTSEATADINEDGQVTLNSRYLIEALGAIEGETVTMSFSGKISPCVLASDKKDVDYKHIIMPLKS